jgi:hypothetical protein
MSEPHECCREAAKEWVSHICFVVNAEEMIDRLAQIIAKHCHAEQGAIEVEEVKPEVRRWLCSGGAGHEDGEDGIRAGTVSMGAAIEIAAEFYVYMTAKPLAQTPPAGDRCPTCGSDDPITRLCGFPYDDATKWEPHEVAEEDGCKKCSNPWHDQPTGAPIADALYRPADGPEQRFKISPPEVVHGPIPEKLPDLVPKVPKGEPQ